MATVKVFRGALVGLGFCTLSSHAVRATYSAAYILKDAIVVGADSRQMNPRDNTLQNDDTCKIIFLNDHLVFTLEGVAGYSYINSKEKLDVPTLVRTFLTISGNKPIAKLAADFGTFLADRLNKAPIDINQVRSVSTNIFFAGMDDGKPIVANSRVSYVDQAQQFLVVDSQSTDRKQIIPFSIPNWTHLYEEEQSFKDVNESTTMHEPDREAAVIHYLIEQMKKNSQLTAIGGEPSIIIMQKGLKARWFTRTKSCPDI